MARDNRVIKSNIRQGGQKYGPGREDELAGVLSQERLDALVESGVLEGDWQHIEAEAEEAAPSEAAQSETTGGAESAPSGDTAPKLTEKVTEALVNANIVIDDTLRHVSDDDLKAAKLNAGQIKNVRAAYGEYEAPVDNDPAGNVDTE